MIFDPVCLTQGGRSSRLRIKAAFEKGTYTDQEYLESKAEIEKGVAEAKLAILQAERESVDLGSIIDYGLILMSNSVHLWDAAKPEDRDLINKALFPDGVYYENEVYRTGEVEDFKALSASMSASLQDGSANGNRTRI